MKKLVLIVIATLFFMGCTIHVVPLNDGRIALPSASYGMEFNTYGAGWGWPFLRSPGVGWGHGGYYGNQYRHYYRWVPGYQRQVCEDQPICYWTWEPAHYE